MGEKENQLIEIYKSQVQLICSISDRQAVMHRHYILVVSALILGLYTLLGNIDKLNELPFNDHHNEILLIGTSILGIIISWPWFDSISYYTYLVSCKHDNLKKLEKELAYPFFETEWEHLDENRRPHIYAKLSNHKLVVPIIFYIFFTLLSALGSYNLGIKFLSKEFIAIMIIPAGIGLAMSFRRYTQLKVRQSE